MESDERESEGRDGAEIAGSGNRDLDRPTLRTATISAVKRTGALSDVTEGMCSCAFNCRCQSTDGNSFVRG
ncbi:hypothetical protein H6P81_018208 [Aristolochia fimbriata]|uniref:Uncharacterized protein n=1 Tax=Aristolochia fimbriata TaxID=158543 RepID=A0AAV7E0P6_ARIFI|nr:hypothetical protein H6P81_018208 [Aristolochia fimbriata]